MWTFASPNAISILVVASKHVPPSPIWDLLTFLALPEGIILQHARGKAAQFVAILHSEMSLYGSQGHHGVRFAQRNLEPKRSLEARAEREKLQEVTQKWIKWERKELAWLEA